MSPPVPALLHTSASGHLFAPWPDHHNLPDSPQNWLAHSSASAWPPASSLCCVLALLLACLAFLLGQARSLSPKMILGSAPQKVSPVAPYSGLHENYRHQSSFLVTPTCLLHSQHVNFPGGKGVHHIYFQLGMHMADFKLLLSGLLGQRPSTTPHTPSCLPCPRMLVQQRT